VPSLRQRGRAIKRAGCQADEGCAISGAIERRVRLAWPDAEPADRLPGAPDLRCPRIHVFTFRQNPDGDRQAIIQNRTLAAARNQALDTRQTSLRATQSPKDELTWGQHAAMVCHDDASGTALFVDGSDRMRFDSAVQSCTSLRKGVGERPTPSRHWPTDGRAYAPRLYSARNTVIGSTRVARQTGNRAARPATAPSTHVEAVSDIQSSGSTP
jgi:hypothetical protein